MPQEGNLLAGSTSPYLLPHAGNPVHWRPWGPEALDEAKRRDRPLLLSVGYAACHWCHVMAHESFEDPALAALMNDLFVNVKVDREERPDVDALYMAALHAMGEQGGWPMTMFLSPDGAPFFGGTYWPPTARWGRPSFTQVLNAVDAAWRDKRAELGEQSAGLVAHLAEQAAPPAGRSAPRSGNRCRRRRAADRRASGTSSTANRRRARSASAATAGTGGRDRDAPRGRP